MTLYKAFAVSILASALAYAHCDGLDGPVVQAARRALTNGDVRLVLLWVPPEQETTIRQAFLQAQAVRSLGTDAEKLADTWFFETLVRVHRAAEGASYSGLKPAGSEVPRSVVLGDQAIAQGDLATLETALLNQMRTGLQERFARVRKLARYESGDVKAGREYVSAYVDFVHFVERLDGISNAGVEHGDEHSH